MPIVAFSSAAGLAGLIVLFTVAAYRRWQLAFLVAGLQLAMFPVFRAVQPDDDALPQLAFFVIQTLAFAAIVAWGMFVRGRRQSRRERVPLPRPSRSCASSRFVTPSARASRARCTTCWPTGSRC